MLNFALRIFIPSNGTADPARASRMLCTIFVHEDYEAVNVGRALGSMNYAEGLLF